MADFRKLLFVLVAVATMFATVASAQIVYSCNAAAVPTLVRSEGIAEQMGDILLQCSGLVPSQGITANIRVTIPGTNITSNVLQATPTVTDAILVLDETTQARRGYASTSPLTPAQYQTVYQGVLLSPQEVEFQGVQLAAQGSSGAQTIRITNIRANASALGLTVPAAVFGIVNITGSTTVPVNNALLRVADTKPGLTFSLSTVSYKNCEEPTDTVSLKFQEGFASAFRPHGDADVDNLTAGGAYQNESGFNPGTPLADGSLISESSIGQATQGTRLMARISGTPSGVSLSVPRQITVGANMTLQAVTGTDSSGGGGTVTSGTGTVSVTTMIVYEVTFINSLSYGSQETVTVPVSVDYSIPGPLTTPDVKAKGSFAPLSTVIVASATAPEPRFVDNAEDKTAFTIGPCRTILLFPFVSNQGGWDTGLAIANTSDDPIGTTNQDGACSLYYFGDSNGGPPPTSPQTTASVAAGTVAVGTLSSGGVIPAAPGFQGYIFAICEFQYAHGYAFISDLGATKLAQGYLALIVPDRSRVPQDSSTKADDPDFSNHGEQLSN